MLAVLTLLPLVIAGEEKCGPFLEQRDCPCDCLSESVGWIGVCPLHGVIVYRIVIITQPVRGDVVCSNH
ncbi:hypothetical protein OIU74_001463 [Salix koriyanagi]|uniref:Uncharacterized protein n=1 Tax=Salix koriyanagi TaxID=2511006 RepID=A0A9Q0X3R7_9ROSI|nr:hypothetical protein OIU74_001463 [Salix koriyanagi]